MDQPTNGSGSDKLHDNTAQATDEQLARLRSMIGKRVDIKDSPYLSEVTRDSARRWACATENRSRLYLLEDYARASPHKTLIAPRTMLYAFSRLSIGHRGGLTGVHLMFGGTHWRSKGPVKLGQSISPDVTPKDLIDLSSRFAESNFKQISAPDFKTVDVVSVVESEPLGFCMERTKVKEKGKYNCLEFKQYTRADIYEIVDGIIRPEVGTDG